MVAAGYLQCDGCNCRTRTVPADPTGKDWPLCEHFPDGGIAPYHYAIIARCFSNLRIGLAEVFTLFAPVTLLQKACSVGCDWYVLGAAAVNNNEGLLAGALPDITADAINNPQAFPPAAYPIGGPLTFHPGDYHNGNDSTAPVGEAGTQPQWTLTVSGTGAGSVVMTLTHPDFVTWAAANGKPTPYYTNVDAWKPFGTNTGDDTDADFGNRMVIDTTGYAAFPQLPKAICVVALDEPHTNCENPCSSLENRRICCDFLPDCDTGQLEITMIHCDLSSDVQIVVVNRHTSSTTLPCGPKERYPASAPCGVFWTPQLTIAPSECDGTSEAEGWDGFVGEMFWCDPSDPENPYKGEAYCYNSFLGCWVFQGLLDISNFVCCPVPTFDAVFPTLECCCEGGGSCCPDATWPGTLTANWVSTCFGTFSCVLTGSGAGSLYSGTCTGEFGDSIETVFNTADCTVSVKCNGSGGANLFSVAPVSCAVPSFAGSGGGILPSGCGCGILDTHAVTIAP